MPYTIRKLPKKNCWQVKNKRTGTIHAKCSTKNKAEAQKRLPKKTIWREKHDGMA